MGQLNNPEGPQPTGARRDDLLATWWERVLAGVAIDISGDAAADVVVRGWPRRTPGRQRQHGEKPQSRRLLEDGRGNR